MTKKNLWARINKIESGCWNWTGAVSSQSKYGYVRWESKTVLVHRLIYKLLVGDIPEGLTLDHTCRNHLCVNPEHLRPLSRAENVMIGESIPARNARKTHCKHGHAFSVANTYWNPNTSHRTCIACYTGRCGKRLNPNGSLSK